MLKKWLKIKDIDFTEIDITEDEGAFNLLVNNNRRSLPQLSIEDNFVDYDEFNDILDLIK